MRNEVNSLRSPPSLPEVAVTQQDSSNVATEIKVSVEEELALLRERNRQLEAENTIFREGFTRIYNTLSSTYSAKGKNEKKTVEKYARTVEKFDGLEDRTGYLATMAENMIEALATQPTPPVSDPTGPDPLHYDVKTLNQKRGEALVAHIQQTGKSSIKSPEARAVLETVEGRGLDRKSVWRALRTAQGILRATADKVGGVSRLIFSPPPCPPGCTLPNGLDGRHDLGGGGGVPRPRMDRVPWDG